MLDVVFWKQVESVWSKDSDIRLADESKIIEKTVSQETVDDMMDFKL